MCPHIRRNHRALVSDSSHVSNILSGLCILTLWFLVELTDGLLDGTIGLHCCSPPLPNLPSVNPKHVTPTPIIETTATYRSSNPSLYLSPAYPDGEKFKEGVATLNSSYLTATPSSNPCER